MSANATVSKLHICNYMHYHLTLAVLMDLICLSSLLVLPTFLHLLAYTFQYQNLKHVQKIVVSHTPLVLQKIIHAHK